MEGDRRLVLTHRMHNQMPLAERDAQAVLACIADLWGYDAELVGIGADDVEKYRYQASPPA